MTRTIVKFYGCFLTLSRIYRSQKIQVQEIFYLRQLSVNVFCIYYNKSNKAHIFVYHQGTAGKGPDVVCSLLFNYLMEVEQQYTKLHLFSDSCWGQNKNHSLSRLLLAMTELKKFEKIEQFYPTRGHSFLPCDRDFSIIKWELNQHDRLYKLDQVCDLIKKLSKNDKFVVHKVQSSEILDFKTWWPSFYLKKLYFRWNQR